MMQQTDEKVLFDEGICPAERCTGCFACKNICPKDAIETVTDPAGRTLPQIDPQKCIRCGACKNVCPVNRPVEFRLPQGCFAAQRRDPEVRRTSASGGIGAALAETVLARGGVVYGAAVAPGGTAAHIRAESAAEAERLKSSKYVQSDIGLIYRDVRAQLRGGREVLFFGTPCQIAGLKNFLGRPGENLKTVDIVCHGVAPMQYLRAHLAALLPEKTVGSYTFRGGEKDFHLRVFDPDGNLLLDRRRELDPYYLLFYNGTICRENCFSCPYAKSERCSDLTIGDFWGLDRTRLQTPQTGKISLVLTNTPAGAQLFEAARPLLTAEPRDAAEAVAGNERLRQPLEKPARRETFLRLFLDGAPIEQCLLDAGGQEAIDAFLRSQRFDQKVKRKLKTLLGR